MNSWDTLKALFGLFVEAAPPLPAVATIDKTAIYERDFPGVIDRVIVACTYDESMKRAIESFKYGGDRSLSKPFVESLLTAYRHSGVEDVDVITCVPSQPLRWFFRPYNQSAVLAKDLSKYVDIPYQWLLRRRLWWSRRQAKLSRAERLSKQQQFTTAKKDIPPTILIIDDVISTGATIAQCALTLKASGAKRVIALIVATGS